MVITGTSSGLGEACTLHLSRVGFHVFAGVRRPEDGERLRVAATDVARVVFRALVAERPRTRCTVGRDATGSRVLARLLPARAINRILGAVITPAR